MDKSALDFLSHAGWANATALPVTPDWSPRQYWRLIREGGETAMLLQGPAEEVQGHGLPDFIRLAAVFRETGLSVPAVYAADPDHRFLLLEDFGSIAIDMPSVEKEGYETATDVLALLRNAQPHTPVPDYKAGYIYKRLPLFAQRLGNDDVRGWMDAWARAEAALPACPHVFSHMDYKAGNLHWLAARSGPARLGILDFQAAQNAPFTYDIVNLLEDARRTLNPALKTLLMTRFEEALPEAWKSFFDDWYALIAAQFHARVLGQITGASHVATDIAPRLRACLIAELAHPALAPVRAWVQANSDFLG